MGTEIGFAINVRITVTITGIKHIIKSAVCQEVFEINQKFRKMLDGKDTDKMKNLYLILFFTDLYRTRPRHTGAIQDEI